MKFLVTGGAGFIGSAFIRLLLGRDRDRSRRVVNLDKLTYAGNLENLAIGSRTIRATASSTAISATPRW